MKKKTKIRWALTAYDIFILAMVDLLLLVFSGDALSPHDVGVQFLIAWVCIFAVRVLGNAYGQILRYGGIQCYIRLIMTDAVAFVLMFIVERCLPVEHISLARMLAIASMNLLGSLTIRMFYRYAYKCGTENTAWGRFLLKLLSFFAGSKVAGERKIGTNRIHIAIIGASRVGVNLSLIHI